MGRNTRRTTAKAGSHSNTLLVPTPRKKAKKSGEMEPNQVQRRWENIPEDILATIFSKLDGQDLFKTVYGVCSWWRTTCRLMVFWRGDKGLLDLSTFKNIGRTVDGASHFMQLLNSLLDQLDHKLESVMHIDLPRQYYLSDVDLSYLAQRLPKLQGLHLPYTTDMVTKVGFSRVIQRWNEITKLTIGPIKSDDCVHVIREIGKNCKNLEYLQIGAMDVKNDNAFVLDEYTSRIIVTSLRKVQHLAFTNCLFYKSGLMNITGNCLSVKEITVTSCRHAMTEKLNSSKNGYGIATYILGKCNTEEGLWSIKIRRYFYSSSSITDTLW